MKSDQSDSTQHSADPLDKTQPSAAIERLSYNHNDGQIDGQPKGRQKTPTVRERAYLQGVDEVTRQVGATEGEGSEESSRGSDFAGQNRAGQDKTGNISEPYMSFGDGIQPSQSSPPQAVDAPLPANGGDSDRDELLDTIYVGKYELLSVIGAGGMGVIYLGRQIFLDRLVAIKMLKSNLASAKARMRFHQEGKAASALHHPAIVAINDFGIDELDRPYMVMEHVEGVTLSEVIKERVTLNVAEAMPIFLELLDGLAVAHSKGIVHRDIKPGNIMLTMGDDAVVHVKLLDFGIAKLLDDDDNTMQSLTKTGEALGTPLYMSPEQIQSHKIDYRSDLYSLGCVMYACLTGAPPFIGEHKFQTMDLHLTEKPVSLKEASFGLDFPVELEQVIMRLLEKAPGERYQSADEVRKILIELSRALGLLKANSALPGNALERGTTAGVSYPSTLARMVPTPGQSTSSSLSSPAISPRDQIKTEVDSPADTTQKFFPQGGTAGTSTHTGLSSRPLSPGSTGTRLPSASRPAQPRSQDVTRSYTSSITEIDHSNFADDDEDHDQDDDSEEIPTGFTAKQKISALIGALFILSGLVYIPTFFTEHKSSDGTASKNLQTPTTVSKSSTVTEPSSVTHVDPLSAAPDADDDASVISNLSRSKNLAAWTPKGVEGMTDKAMPGFAAQKNLKELSLVNTKVTSEGLQYIAHLPVETLWLNGTRVDSSGMKYLAQMPDLNQLFMADTHIDNQATAEIGKKMHLTSLSIGGTGVTIDGVKSIAASRKLQNSLVNLELGNLDLGNEIFAVLKPLTRLKNLDLRNNRRISGQGFEDLTKLTGVDQLTLAYTNVTDQDLRKLLGMQQLVLLDISHTKVSFFGLRQLGALKNLNTLWLGKLVPSASEQLLLKDFQRLNPQCKVWLVEHPTYTPN